MTLTSSRPVHLVQTAETETRCTSEPSQERRRLCQFSPACKDGAKSFTKHRLPQSHWSWWYSWPFAKEMCPKLGTIPYSNFHCLIRCENCHRRSNRQTLPLYTSPEIGKQPATIDQFLSFPSWASFLRKLCQRSSKLSWLATVFFLKSSLPTAPTTQLPEDALAFIVNRLLLERDCGKATGLVFVDLSKAFDRVKTSSSHWLVVGHRNLWYGSKVDGRKLPKWPTTARSCRKPV